MTNSRKEKISRCVIGDNGRRFNPGKGVPHGTANGYDYYGCQCNPCTAAKAKTAKNTRRNRRINSARLRTGK